MSTFEQAGNIVGLAETIIEALKHYPQDIQVAALKCVLLVPGLEKARKQ